MNIEEIKKRIECEMQHAQISCCCLIRFVDSELEAIGGKEAIYQAWNKLTEEKGLIDTAIKDVSYSARDTFDFALSWAFPEESEIEEFIPQKDDYDSFEADMIDAGWGLDEIQEI